MHLTDEQLNEYLDHETNERAQIELHISTCEECSARLAALQKLFSEIESLPELELSRNVAARFIPSPSLPAKLPRSLTFTLTLQAALALVTIIVAAPFVLQFVSSYTLSLSVPSLFVLLPCVPSLSVPSLSAPSRLFPSVLFPSAPVPFSPAVFSP